MGLGIREALTAGGKIELPAGPGVVEVVAKSTTFPGACENALLEVDVKRLGGGTGIVT